MHALDHEFWGISVSTGVLMKNIGLLPWLRSAFRVVEKMLIGKKFPMNLRTLGFAMLELLRNHVEEMENFGRF